jgi:hypothetical protein
MVGDLDKAQEFELSSTFCGHRVQILDPWRIIG